MSKLNISYPKGATPLDPNELNGLIPIYITTQGELNQLEQENILAAQEWVFDTSHVDVLGFSFVLELHKKMFGQVWRWAGTPRTSEKNIGIPKEQILTQTKQLVDDLKYWIDNKTYLWPEIAARLHHRLVFIHVFPNGNGRHARLLTDVVLLANYQKRPTWGLQSSKTNIDSEGQSRSKYIGALKLADGGDYKSLIEFVNS
jgi:Fic-DOC domain mobile mystery protein B